MNKLIISLCFIFSSLVLAETPVFSSLPDRFFPSFEWEDIDTLESSPIFTSRFGEVFNRYGKSSTFLEGEKIFGPNRPLNQEQFIKLRDELSIGEKISYREYVAQWIREQVAPHYFKAVLDLEANNHQVKKALVNKIFFELMGEISKQSGVVVAQETIKAIREFVATKLIIKIEKNVIEIASSEFSKAERGSIERPLVIDFSPVLKLAKDSAVDDETFYQAWMSYTLSSIEKFFQFSRRLLVVENEVQKQMQMDPFFLLSSYPGDNEYIYSTLINGDRNVLKRKNYQARVLKVILDKKDISWFKKYLLNNENIDDFSLIEEIFDRRSIPTSQIIVNKYGPMNSEETLGLLEGEVKELWNPIRILKNKMFVYEQSEGIFLIAGAVDSLGVYTFPLTSSFARESIRQELQTRKRKILYQSVVNRLAKKHPLIINVGGCYHDLIFCFEKNIDETILGELVRVQVNETGKDYLSEIDSTIFEQSIY